MIGKTAAADVAPGCPASASRMANENQTEHLHTRRVVFVSGATGYIGRQLVERLIARGHEVRALARPGSEDRLPAGARAVLGNALDASSFAGEIAPAGTLVHLVGVAKPSPWKREAFRRVDLGSLLASLEAAKQARVTHVMFVSVAQPAPVMRAYVEVRAECERAIRESGLDATVLRPWYVLGPGHRWPLLLVPAYAVLERIPATREGALRLGLNTIAEVTSALAWAVESPAQGYRIVDVQGIRRLGGEPAPSQAARSAEG